MRLLTTSVAFAALLFAQKAAAQTVGLAPISFSADLQTELDEELGAREGEVLQRAVTSAVEQALTRRGAMIGEPGALRVEIAIVDADPNRPTREQLAGQPGLDALRSISVGGAELHAVLRGADGQVLEEVSHRQYDQNIRDAQFSNTTWGTARRAMRQFATKVANAYAAHAS